MTKLLLAGLVSLPVLLASSRPAAAQVPTILPPGCGGAALASYPAPGPVCGYMHGCSGFCMSYFWKIHFHGPLFNYGPYQGYYPFEPYGPWTADLQYNPPPANCCHGNGCGACSRWSGWQWYAKQCWTNLCQRINPLGHKCNKGGWSDCSGCGGSGCAAPGATAVTIPSAPATVAAGQRS
jgi:hypothetical protein